MFHVFLYKLCHLWSSKIFKLVGRLGESSQTRLETQEWTKPPTNEMCACLCPYSIPLFKYPHFRIVFSWPFNDSLISRQTQVTLRFVLNSSRPRNFMVNFMFPNMANPCDPPKTQPSLLSRHLITCTCFDPEPQRIPAQSAVNGLNILRQERCRRLNMAMKHTHWPLLFVQHVIPKFRKKSYGLFLITPQFAA